MVNYPLPHKKNVYSVVVHSVHFVPELRYVSQVDSMLVSLPIFFFFLLFLFVFEKSVLKPSITIMDLSISLSSFPIESPQSIGQGHGRAT